MSILVHTHFIFEVNFYFQCLLRCSDTSWNTDGRPDASFSRQDEHLGKSLLLSYKFFEMLSFFKKLSFQCQTMQITSLLSPFHLGIDSAIVFESLLNYGVPIMKIPDIESFCQQNKNQLDIIKYAKCFPHHRSILIWLIFCIIFSIQLFHFLEEYSAIFFLSWLFPFLEENSEIFFLTWLFPFLNKPNKFWHRICQQLKTNNK